MTIRCWSCLALVAGMLGVPQSSHAQYLANATPAVLAGVGQDKSAKSALDTPFSVELTNVTLQAALTEIARRSGVRITFSRTVLPLDKRVSIRAAQMTVGAALQKVLEGTDGRPQLTPAGQVVIVRLDAAGARVSGGIVGRVVNAKTKQPIPGATVTLGGGKQSVVSGNDGTFRLSAEAGEQEIQVRSVGFVRQARRIVVEEGKDVSVEVALEPSASVLDEVVVTGTVVATERKAIATPITVITAAEIERRGITRIEEFFRGEVPGVLALERGSETYNDLTPGEMVTSKIFSRGSSGFAETGITNPLKTYIDGVELLDPSYLGTIDPRSIERIEIITGPQAATIYGSGAMGGVMQIFTKKGSGQSTPDVTLSLRYGMLESNLSTGRTPTHRDGLSVVGGLGPSFSYSGNVSYDYTGQWQPALFHRGYGASIGASHIRGALTVTGSVSTTYGTNGTSIRGWIRSRARSETGEFWLPNFLPVQHTTQRISSASSQTVSLNLNYRLSPIWQHSIAVGKTQTDFTVVPEHPSYTSTQDTLYRESRSTGNRISASYNSTLVGQFSRGISSTLTFGVNGSWGDQVRMDGCTASAEATSWVACSQASVVNVNRLLRDRHWGGFGSIRLGFFEQLFLNFGLRGEQSPNYGGDHKIDWTPTNGAAYTLEYNDLSVKLLGSYGRATRVPPAESRLQQLSTFDPYWAPSQYITRTANPDLTPEYSRGPEGGIEIYYNNFGSLTINHYQQKITDLIQLVVVDSVLRTEIFGTTTRYSGQTQYRNVASIQQTGWEATGAGMWRAFSVTGTYSWNDSRVLVSREPQYAAGQSFLLLPTHTGSVNLGYSAGNTTISVTTNIIGGANQLIRTLPTFYDASNARLKIYVPLSRRPGNFDQASRAGYMKSNLAAQHRLSANVSATLHVTNLGNSYASEAMPDMAVLGRQTLVGLTIRFPKE